MSSGRSRSSAIRFVVKAIEKAERVNSPTRRSFALGRLTREPASLLIGCRLSASRRARSGRPRIQGALEASAPSTDGAEGISASQARYSVKPATDPHLTSL